jgi:hypothetical protein
MMTNNRLRYARASVAAIAAAALTPTYVAASPKPIVDLSASPAISGEGQPAPAQPTQPPKRMIGPVDERTAEIGGGALAVLALGAGALALRSRKRRREDEEAWNYEATSVDQEEHHASEPMVLTNPVHEPQPAIVAPKASAFAWGNSQACDEPLDDGSDRCPGETWVERAHRGPSPANPSMSLKTRLGRAAFFDKREREVAAGKAAPIDPDAGLPDAMVEEQERELT